MTLQQPYSYISSVSWGHLYLIIVSTFSTQAHPRNPSLSAQLGVMQLPALSASNVRQLLQAVLPLPELSP
jgi:hypothetical protein